MPISSFSVFCALFETTRIEQYLSKDDQELWRVPYVSIHVKIFLLVCSAFIIQ